MPTQMSTPAEYPLYVAGKPVKTGQWLEVQHKFHHDLYARVALADDLSLIHISEPTRPY